jgi:hypothetical protein
MSFTTHTFTPRDNSLSAKVSAYKTVARDYANVRKSLKYANDKEWKHSLGEKQEIEKAHQIMQNSIKVATSKISLSEIKQAKDEGLINQAELVGFVQNKRLAEHQSKKEQRNQQQHSRTFSQRR